MKRVFISDLHLHTWTYGATVNEEGMNTRLAAQAAALSEVVAYVKENDIKYVYLTGDMFHVHGRIPVQALRVAVDFVDDIRDTATFLAIYGNHDMDDKAGYFTAIDWLAWREMVRNTEHAGWKVLTQPYTEDEEVLKRFLGDAGEGGEDTLLLLHQGVAGVPLSSGFVLDEKLTPDMIPPNCMAFTGHYHFHKRVSPNLTVVGNLTPLNWSDIDQTKGFVVWDDETGVIEQIPQKSSPPFLSWNERIETHSSLINLKGAFVRYTGVVKQQDQEKIRQYLIESGGALTVEFPKVEIEGGTTNIRKGEEITVEHLAQQYETEDMEPRRREVGREIREQRYEATKA